MANVVEKGAVKTDNQPFPAQPTYPQIRHRRWVPIFGWLLIFLYAGTIESWPFTFRSSWLAAICTLPLNVLLPMTYLVVRIHSELVGRARGRTKVLFRSTVALLAVSVLVAQWAWMVNIRIALNERALALEDRALLWQPTNEVYLAISAYRREHDGIWPRELRQVENRSARPYGKPASGTTGLRGIPVAGSLATLNLPHGKLRILYVGAGIASNRASGMHGPVLLSWLGTGLAGFMACMSDGRCFWIDRHAAPTVLRLWNHSRGADGLARIPRGTPGNYVSRP